MHVSGVVLALGVSIIKSCIFCMYLCQLLSCDFLITTAHTQSEFLKYNKTIPLQRF